MESGEVGVVGRFVWVETPGRSYASNSVLAHVASASIDMEVNSIRGVPTSFPQRANNANMYDRVAPLPRIKTASHHAAGTVRMTAAVP